MAKIYGAYARAVAIIHEIPQWMEADWYDPDTGVLSMKDGRRYAQTKKP